MKEVKKKFSRITFAWKEVFSKKKYILISIVTALIFYVLSAILNNTFTIFDFWKSLGTWQTMVYIFNLVLGFKETVYLHAYYNVILLSILTGMLLSLILYKFEITHFIKPQRGFLGLIGVFLAFIVPGCASCGIGLIALFGLGGALSSLPFGGNELSFFASALMVFVVLKFSNEIFICKNIRKPLKK